MKIQRNENCLNDSEKRKNKVGKSTLPNLIFTINYSNHNSIVLAKERKSKSKKQIRESRNKLK